MYQQLLPVINDKKWSSGTGDGNLIYFLASASKNKELTLNVMQTTPPHADFLDSGLYSQPELIFMQFLGILRQVAGSFLF